MNKHLNTLKFLLLALVFAAGVSYAWTTPAGSPPSNNVSAPINVGSSTQNKSGALGLDILSIFKQAQISKSDYVATSSLLLGVDGSIGATEYCDKNGQNCSTPPFGTGGGGGTSPVFITTTNLTAGTVTADGWTNFDVSSKVPAGSSAAIIYFLCGGTNSHAVSYARADASSPESLFFRFGIANTDGVSGVQSIVPLSSNRTFQMKGYCGGYGPVALMGYFGPGGSSASSSGGPILITSAVNNSTPNITFTPPAAGTYIIEATGNLSASTGRGAGTVVVSVNGVAVPNSQNIRGYYNCMSSNCYGSDGSQWPFSVMGGYTFTSTTPVTLSLGTASTNNVIWKITPAGN